MRTLLFCLASGMAISCVSTTLETKSSHPANPQTATTPAATAPTPLASSFDPFEAYATGLGNAGPNTTQSHAGHGAAAAPPASNAGAGVDHSAHSPPADQQPPGAAPAKPLFTCPMHPDVQRDAPGQCPVCGMRLVPKKAEPDHSSH